MANETPGTPAAPPANPAAPGRSPRLEILYCTDCRWLLRASWLAQEILTTFPTELGEVALVPGHGGVFEVRLEGKLVFSRAERRRFPEPKEIKQVVRDLVDPTRDLGHSDRARSPSAEEPGRELEASHDGDRPLEQELVRGHGHE